MCYLQSSDFSRLSLFLSQKKKKKKKKNLKKKTYKAFSPNHCTIYLRSKESIDYLFF